MSYKDLQNLGIISLCDSCLYNTAHSRDDKVFRIGDSDTRYLYQNCEAQHWWLDYLLKLYWALTSSQSSQLYLLVINTRGRKQSNRARDFKPICQLEFRYLHQNCDAQHFSDPNNVQPYYRDTPPYLARSIVTCPNTANYTKNSIRGAYLGTPNMVNWGVPEKILQNAVQTHWS